MAESISVTITQIGTGTPLSTPQISLIGVEPILHVWPTQPQAGGGIPFDRFMRDPATAAATYSRIDVSNGIGKTPTFYYSSELVAAIQTKINT